MAAESVVAFWVVSLALIAVPGPDWAFIIGAGARGRPVYLAVGGLVAGYAAVTLAVAAGVGALVAGDPGLLGVLTVAGGAYLIWHGVTTFAARPGAAATRGTPAGERGVFLRGIGVSALNPKGLLIFVALLPQFTDPRDAWPIAAQIIALGLTFILTVGLFYLAVGRLTRSVLAVRPGSARLLGRLSGAAMIALGAWLLAAHLIGG
ncbi:LysE family translocator [Spongiactinospora sp. TRM90649]|uniref:LysE family translocator n=1 Tax=Spongiactinospora sp. TRM90649 TaxID=3031114 RepID=UPI0023F80F60|nr:LysE family translocator [Spongiactinospora sp. TRM90649]MDF5757451.1 LysE family translocator [Spongiactinospora sp. TRM90649]